MTVPYARQPEPTQPIAETKPTPEEERKREAREARERETAETTEGEAPETGTEPGRPQAGQPDTEAWNEANDSSGTPTAAGRGGRPTRGQATQLPADKPERGHATQLPAEKPDPARPTQLPADQRDQRRDGR